jgi:hypothetical protein
MRLWIWLALGVGSFIYIGWVAERPPSSSMVPQQSAEMVQFDPMQQVKGAFFDMIIRSTKICLSLSLTRKLHQGERRREYLANTATDECSREMANFFTAQKIGDDPSGLARATVLMMAYEELAAVSGASRYP